MSGQWHGGKGSDRRTMSISQQEWDSRWDAIFGRDVKKDTSEQPDQSVDKTDESDIKSDQ